MQKESALRFSKNWFFWSGLFASGTLLSLWWEWQSDVSHSIGWFIAISLWSAVCAIGYSLIDWISKK
ncbi:hypothetical protein MNBD_GAMMA25-2331 [hydrothermal vent metagenome]|uniref:Uncharacterized protein n=1 Tax=hydrothermal vent metagenome TaxID=652676 RepID=A0A3B1AUD3_9ZZZZ